ncbi:MAG: cache domain-containing protein, partial [Gemmatimonadota bacterium]|nr:cache domain-containing protein [Gemmatimonadota bacterium]
MNGIMRPFRWLGSRSLVRSLRFRLVLVVLLASLPSFALLFLTAAQQREDAVAAGQDESRRLASLIAANQSNVATQIGTVLSATVDLLDQTPEGCRQVLRRLIVPTTTPLEGRSGPDLGVDGATFVQVVVLDDALGEFCVGSAGGGLLGEVERELAANALDAGRLVTGNRQTSAAGSMVLTYAMPVETEDAGGNQVNRVIGATVEVYALTQFVLEANLPRDSFIFVVDSEGVLEQRYP